MPIKILSFIFYLLLIPNIYANTIAEYTLDNGLKVIVKEDHRTPVAILQVWYKVGSSYEYNGITGISHMLEHMMFKGTINHPPGEYSDLVAAEGGEENAFTSLDYTAYYIQIANDRLKLAFELEADRMQNLQLNEKEFIKERAVVEEERLLRTEDRPQSLAYEQFTATAYISSPYHHPVIGWRSDIQNYTLADVQTWYNRWYAPNNAILVVIGDIQAEQIYTLAQQYFASIPPAKLTPAKPQPEIPQYGEKRIKLNVAANAPSIYMGYKVPSLKTAAEKWEAYALEILTYALDGDDSSRLVNHLVRDQSIAAGISASYDLYDRLESMIFFFGLPTEASDLATLEQALYQEITAIKEQGLTEEELTRIKTQLYANEIYEKDSLFYQAYKIGSLESIGLSWQDDADYLTHIQAITSEQVQQVAQKYLIEKNLTIAEIYPSN